MDGKFVLGFLNYLMLSLIFIFGLVSLIVKDQKKKLSFLFFMLFSAGILSYLFFAGIAFMLPGIILLFFCLAVFIMVAGQEYFGYGKPGGNMEQHLKKQDIKRIDTGVIINLVLSIVLCAGAGFIFFYYNRSFYEGLMLVESFNVAGMPEIVSNIGLNYIPVILLAICVLTSSFIWFLIILGKRRDRN